MKHLLKLLDLSTEEITEILNLADQLKYEQKHGIEHHHLKGKTLGMIFAKASTRTRVSFETGMYQLGGYPMYLSANDMQIGRGEPIQDTARVLSRYLDGIMIRTFEQKQVEDLAEYGSIPIINALTDFAHPCQVLADQMTIRERKGSLEGLQVCYIGDGNNMANSIIVGCLKMGMQVAVACPDAYRPDPQVLEFAKAYPGFRLTDSPKRRQKAPMPSLRMFGLPWDRKMRRKSGKRRLPAIRSMRKSWPWRNRMLWFSTACLLTAARKSLPKCLKAM